MRDVEPRQSAQQAPIAARTDDAHECREPRIFRRRLRETNLVTFPADTEELQIRLVADHSQANPGLRPVSPDRIDHPAMAASLAHRTRARRPSGRAPRPISPVPPNRPRRSPSANARRPQLAPTADPSSVQVQSLRHDRIMPPLAQSPSIVTQPDPDSLNLQLTRLRTDLAPNETEPVEHLTPVPQPLQSWASAMIMARTAIVLAPTWPDRHDPCSVR
jgi:hypothetical protein